MPRRRKPQKPSLFDTIDPDPNASAFPGIPLDRVATIRKGEVRRAEGKVLSLCWLPSPQPRRVLLPLPGRREDKLWFEKDQGSPAPSVPPRPEHPEIPF